LKSDVPPAAPRR